MSQAGSEPIVATNNGQSKSSNVGEPNTTKRPVRVLVVDDEMMVLRGFKRVLGAQGYDVFTLDNGLEAVDVARREEIDVVLLDIRMPLVSGLEVLDQLKAALVDVEVIMMTGHAAVDTALQAIKAGAYDYLTKPFEKIEDVVHVVSKAVERKRLRERNRYLESELSRVGERRLIGSSAAIREVYRLIEAVAPSDANVLIQGESGTGKEVVAHEIHRLSRRSEGPWTAINCSALTETLLESELFGHVKGAFTGAIADKAGLLQTANHGTLFLDEVGDLPSSIQVKLLRVLQDREIRPVGGTRSTLVDVRIICATNVDLQKAMRESRFREDLFYRINVINIRIAPLRERVEDIPLLAQYFLQRFAKKSDRDQLSISAEAMEAMCALRWPGNVRELENAIERAVVLCRGEKIRPDDLPNTFGDDRATRSPIGGPDLSAFNFAEAKKLAVSHFEKGYIETLLRRAKGNVSEAARQAKLDRSNFKRIATKYAVRPEDFRED